MRISVAALGVVLAALALGSPSFGASAADKATAREAATQGIESYRAGKYAEALDKLRRAQALYDAPVHLLYIARSQDKLGQLVEASENYRLLDHYTLPEGAPEAWVSAVADGQKELAALEPRIPKLRVGLAPAEVQNPTLSIDGASVSAAVVGIERPVNPGKHHVEVSAPGYRATSGDIEVAEKESKDLTLTLEKDGSAGTASADTGAPAPDSHRRAPVGFMAGLRLGGSIPTGKLLKLNGTDGAEVKVSDAFQPGGGVELHAGVRIAQYFTPVLFLEGEKYDSGSGFLNQNKLKNAAGSSLGLGLLVGTPPGQMGGFGEIDFAIAHSLSVSYDELGKTCTVTGSGGGLRIGGGGVFPVIDWLHLTPFVMMTFARINKLETEGCSALVPSGDVKSGDQRTHGVVFIGVGGDVVLGNDRQKR